MTATLIQDVQNQVQKFWAPMFEDQLKEQTLLPSLVSKKYQGEIKKGGDRVRVSQVNRPTAQIRDIGVNSDSFDSSLLSTQYIDITANKRFVASFEFEDLVEIQSQIGDQNSKIRQALVEAMEIKLNDYLYSLVAASSSAPDHILNGVTDFNAAQLNSVRKLAAQAKWSKTDGWYLLVDPSYMTDVLSATTLVSSDYGASDAPVIGGQMALKRFGFNILEDNSAGLVTYGGTLGSATEDFALAFHPDFLHLVMGQPEFKISDLHSNKRFGYVISVNMWGGAALGNDGNKKHIQIYNT